MEEDVRTTLYINGELDKRFRQACAKMFGDKQGKIKQGYVLAITNFCDEVLDVKQDSKQLDQDGTISPDLLAKNQSQQEDLLAKKILQESINDEAQASVNLDHGELRTITAEEIPKSFTNEEIAKAKRSEEIIAKAKKLAEERKQSTSDHKILQ